MPELGLELVRDVDAERIRSCLPRWDPRLWGDAQFSKNTRPGNRLLKLGLAWGRERVKARKLQQENATLQDEVAPVSRFTGKEEDVEVGLQYFGKRYLSPYLGRWISADPLAVHVPGSADLNLYAYVRGAVLKNVDPLGLQDHTAGTDTQGPVADEPIKDEAPPASVPKQLERTPDPMTPTMSGTRGRGGIEEGITFTIPEVVIAVDVDKFFDPRNYGPTGSGGTPPAPPALPESLDNGVKGQGNDGPVKPSTVLNAAKGHEAAVEFMAYEAAGVAVAKYTLRLSRAAELNQASRTLHGNSAGEQTAFLYERYDAEGNFLKHGITQDLGKRYSQKELNGGYLIETASGPRREMLKLERELVETNPGPLNKEPWAGARKPHE